MLTPPLGLGRRIDYIMIRCGKDPPWTSPIAGAFSTERLPAFGQAIILVL